MTIILLVLLVIAIGFLIQQQRYRRRLVKSSTKIIGDLVYDVRALTVQRDAVDANYKALEEGQQEIVDNYENDLLDMRTRMEAAQNAAVYDREKREEAESKIKQWDEAIEKHSEHCDSIIPDMVDLMMRDIFPKEEDMIQHNHTSDESCDEAGCTADRYVDGKHVFTDTTIETKPADG